jgi:hypothetical protein
MRSTQVAVGRHLVVVFDEGDSFFTALAGSCRNHRIQPGHDPGFVAGFREVDVLGTCDRIENPNAPVWSKVHPETAEAHR